MFLGVDGGGTKTAYAVLDAHGKLRASTVGPSVSHLAEGFARAGSLLSEGIKSVLARAGMPAVQLQYAFIGLPSYGEDSATTSQLDALPGAVLGQDRYRCGNDMVCSWAGALGCEDGISVIAGTGSMAYGEYDGRAARAGGWGELIGDEGSAYWIAREGMNLFSRMSDGRCTRGPLYELVRRRFGIDADLDLCAHVYADGASKRSTFAQFAPLVDEAAQAGDTHAMGIFARSAEELAACVAATRHSLAVAPAVRLPVSHTGGVFDNSPRMVNAFKAALAGADLPYAYLKPRFAPEVGAALYAARLAGADITQMVAQRTGAERNRQ